MRSKIFAEEGGFRFDRLMVATLARRGVEGTVRRAILAIDPDAELRFDFGRCRLEISPRRVCAQDYADALAQADCLAERRWPSELGDIFERASSRVL